MQFWALLLRHKKKDYEVEENNNTNNNYIIDYSYLQTVKKNTNFLTKEEISRAYKARIYQSILCCPSTTSYINIVENNIITICEIKSDDINRADIIWGPEEYLLQGKIKNKQIQQNSKTDTASIGIKTT